MISQIIEARPEDLRVYLEEAAGISKYKERRKETETRIRHTRENLDRLNDLREEVGKQPSTSSARRGRPSSTPRSRPNAGQGRRMEGAGFRGLDAQLQGLREALCRRNAASQQLIAEQREAEREIETGRVRREDAAEAL